MTWALWRMSVRVWPWYTRARLLNTEPRRIFLTMGPDPYTIGLFGALPDLSKDVPPVISGGGAAARSQCLAHRLYLCAPVSTCFGSMQGGCCGNEGDQPGALCALHSVRKGELRWHYLRLNTCKKVFPIAQRYGPCGG